MSETPLRGIGSQNETGFKNGVSAVANGTFLSKRFTDVRNFIASLALIAAFLSTELQWSVMQTVTWAHMIQQSESAASFGEKVISTITGEAPCDYCSALAEEKGSERNEVCSLLGKGPFLAPLDSPAFRLTHYGHSLFSLADRHGTESQFIAEGIKPPPRA